MSEERLALATSRIDAVHDQDPARSPDGRASERTYAERMSAWLDALQPTATDALRLAVRAQHLARWRSPREDFPEGRAGYLAWRRAAGQRHAALVQQICLESGYDAAFAARVACIVEKRQRTQDPEVQALEDCACLVFLAHDLDAFAAKHEDDKVIDILRKSWGKMSSPARARALALQPGARAAALLARALSPGPA